MQQPPLWLEILVAATAPTEDSALQALDPGERAAIILAESLRADLLLIDDRAGAVLAQHRGLAGNRDAGSVGLASKAGLLDLHHAFVRLQKTNFRYPPSIMEALLERRDIVRREKTSTS